MLQKANDQKNNDH
jgi:hypothetical protein